MGKYHRVGQGEHLSSIARKYGFSDYKAIWNHEQNAELKTKRQNPNVIFPGDRLFIPVKEEKTEVGSTEQKHRFVLKAETLKLRLVLEDWYKTPIANAKCELHIWDENKSEELTTDDHGMIERDIKPTYESVFLTIKDPQTSINEILIPLKIGYLDPVDEEPGQTSRLNNLGYFAGPFEGKSEEENKALLLSAIEEFQCDHGLVVDGICGPRMQATLKEVYGC